MLSLPRTPHRPPQRISTPPTRPRPQPRPPPTRRVRATSKSKSTSTRSWGATTTTTDPWPCEYGGNPTPGQQTPCPLQRTIRIRRFIPTTRIITTSQPQQQQRQQFLEQMHMVIQHEMPQTEQHFLYRQWTNQQELLHVQLRKGRKGRERREGRKGIRVNKHDESRATKLVPYVPVRISPSTSPSTYTARASTARASKVRATFTFTFTFSTTIRGKRQETRGVTAFPRPHAQILEPLKAESLGYLYGRGLWFYGALLVLESFSELVEVIEESRGEIGLWRGVGSELGL